MQPCSDAETNSLSTKIISIFARELIENRCDVEEEDAQNDSWFLQVETAPLLLLGGRDHDPCRSSSSIALAP